MDLADARAAQTGQAIAYPFNLLLLANPLPCTQLFLTASTVANYDLGAQPLPFLRRWGQRGLLDKPCAHVRRLRPCDVRSPCRRSERSQRT